METNETPTIIKTFKTSGAVAETLADPGNSQGPGIFSPADAASAFFASSFDEAYCRLWILKKLHPGDIRCPECNATIQDNTTWHNFWKGKRCVCKACERGFTATSGTFLHGTQLDFRQLFMLAVLANYKAGGLDTKSIATAVGISPDTVRIWERRFKAIND